MLKVRIVFRYDVFHWESHRLPFIKWLYDFRRPSYGLAVLSLGPGRLRPLVYSLQLHA